MRVFKANFKDRQGNIKETRRYYIDFRDAEDVRRKIPCYTDRRQTGKLAEKIEQLIIHKHNNEPLGRELDEWLQAIPLDIFNNLARIGLIDDMKTTYSKPLLEHLADWKKSLEAKGNTKTHIKNTVPRAEKIITGCKFVYFSDIDAVKIETYLAKKRAGQADKNEYEKDKYVPISKQTSNYYLRAIKQLCKWLVDNGRANSNPLVILKKLPVSKDDEVHPRRALTTDELRRLLSHTANAESYKGVSGRERVLIYRLAVEAGLRADEIRTLQVSAFDFVKNIVTIKAENAKNRKAAVLPLKTATSVMIREFLKFKLLHTKAFQVPERAYLMVKADEKSVGIPYEDEQGRFADFHALRHSFATMLKNSGCHPKTAQQLLRHSDVNLTLGIYTHSLREAEQSAIDALPDLSLPAKDKIRATGTDDMSVTNGKDVLSVCLAKSGTNNQNKPERTGSLGYCVHNVNSDFSPESTILGDVPVAQLDRVSASEAEG